MFLSKFGISEMQMTPKSVEKTVVHTDFNDEFFVSEMMKGDHTKHIPFDFTPPPAGTKINIPPLF